MPRRRSATGERGSSRSAWSTSARAAAKSGRATLAVARISQASGASGRFASTRSTSASAAAKSRLAIASSACVIARPTSSGAALAAASMPAGVSRFASLSERPAWPIAKRRSCGRELVGARERGQRGVVAAGVALALGVARQGDGAGVVGGAVGGRGPARLRRADAAAEAGAADAAASAAPACSESDVASRAVAARRKTFMRRGRRLARRPMASILPRACNRAGGRALPCTSSSREGHCNERA